MVFLCITIYRQIVKHSGIDLKLIQNFGIKAKYRNPILILSCCLLKTHLTKPVGRGWMALPFRPVNLLGLFMFRVEVEELKRNG